MLQARIKIGAKNMGNKNNCKESERLGFHPEKSGKEQPVCFKKKTLSVKPVLPDETLWRGTWGRAQVVGTSEFYGPTPLSGRGLLFKYSGLPEKIFPAVPRISKSVSWACRYTREVDVVTRVAIMNYSLILGRLGDQLAALI